MFSIWSLPIQAETDMPETQLAVTPKQCVALLQGQTCYVTVELNWQVINKGNYCIYSSQQQDPIQCWDSKRQGEVKREFSAKSNLRFFLRQINTRTNLAKAEVKMAWVHKKKGKPRKSWRMF